MSNLAEKYSFRPSSLLDIPSNSWEAYIFDAQCFLAAVEHEKKESNSNSNPNFNSNPDDKQMNPWLGLGLDVTVIHDPNFNGIW